MAKSVAINVGVNKNPQWGNFRGPIFPDGRFEFVHIPWKEKYGMIDPPPKKYEDYKVYDQYIKQRVKREHKYILESPDFRHCVYASTVIEGRHVPANKPIFSLKQGEDYLLFYATLNFYGDESQKESWINKDWGAYLVGLFKIDKIYPGLKEVLADEDAREAFKEYTWFRSLRQLGSEDGGAPWVRGIKEKSGLLEKAIPLSSAEDPERWSNVTRRLFGVAADKKLVPRIVYRCEHECLNELLSKCVFRKDSQFLQDC